MGENEVLRELEETRLMLQLVLNAIPMRIFWKDEDLTYLGSNQAFAQDAGLDSPAEIVGKNDFELMWAEQAERYQANDRQVIESGEPKLNYEDHQTAPDGSNIWMRTSKFPLIDAEGNVKGVLGMYEEVTEEKQAKEALNASLQRLALHVEQTPLGVIEWDLDFQVTDWNPAAERIFGYTREEALGRHAAGLIVPEHVREIVDQIWADLIAQKGGTRSTNANNTKGGEIKFCEWYNTPLVDSDGNVIGVTSLVQDITDRKQAEERMKMMEMAVEQSADGIAVADLEGKIKFANFAWAQMHGYSLEEVQGKNLSIFHTEEQLKNDVVPFNERAMKVGFHQGEVGHARKDGTTFPTMMTSTLLKDDEGNPIGIIGTARDITKQKAAIAEQQRLQQEVIEAQQRALEELSTPVIPIMDRILVMPLIGSIDSMRAKDITRALLRGITQHRAKVVILDVTGVPLVDSGVANHLNKTVQAARLKGARTIVTGISDAVAETIVDLGIDWSGIETLSDLQTGLVTALTNLGVKLIK